MNSRLRDHLLIVLSLGAGAIDAVMLLKLHIFPANMTGNTVVLAVSLADLPRELYRFIPALLALVGFALGAFVGGKLLRNAKREWTPEINRVLMAGAVLILIAGLPGWIGREEQTWMAAPLCAAAMGLQAVAAMQVGVPGVSTNVVTGSISTAMTRFGGPTPSQGSLPLASWGAYLGGALIAALLLPWLNWHGLWIPAIAMVSAVLWSRHAV